MRGTRGFFFGGEYMAHFFRGYYMQSKLKIFGHPLHPMLVPFPIAFNTATMICCMVYAINGDSFWFHVAFIANCAAVVTATIAVLPGLVDWLSIPELTDAKSTGLKHMMANIISVGFFTANAAIMYSELSAGQLLAQSHVLITLFGFFVMLYAGFKGWRLVQTHHIGIDTTVNEEIPEQEGVEKNASEIFTDTKDETGK